MRLKCSPLFFLTIWSMCENCWYPIPRKEWVNALMRVWQNLQHFAEAILKRIFWNENIFISSKISLKCVPYDLMDSKSTLVQVMACCLTGNKPLPESMLTKMFHILWHQWVASLWPGEVIWWHKSGSTLSPVMVWYLMAPSHYLNQCRFLISEVMWH